jgi:glycosyltransferase involved in cell wall biosynthesis
MKIAIVHDYLNQYGGAERCVEVFHELFPEAPIYTSIYLSDQMPESFLKMDIRVSFMQKFPFLKQHFKKYLLFFPLAMKSFNLKAYDVVLSSNSAFSKGVHKRVNAIHVCYCYSPMRFAWDYFRYIENEKFSFIIRMVLPFFIKLLKRWDVKNNRAVDYFIAISSYTKDRIQRCYLRDSEIIYPPVNVANYSISKDVGNYFLLVARLIPYKRIDIVIDAFNKLNLPIRIIGDGHFRSRLEKISESNIRYLGKVSEDALAVNYSTCRALIFPGEEDFGIVPLEAQASGRPVIAYGAGGALETIVNGVTGVFFDSQTSASLIDAVNKFIEIEQSFNSEIIRNNATRFGKEIFKAKIKEFILKKYNNINSR